jgi:hypothetical protein
MLRPWKKRILPVALLASCFWPLAALAQGLYQQYLDGWKHASDPFEIWVFANGQKLAEFMPQPVPGLVEHLPWEPIDNYLPHFKSYAHHQYLGLAVGRIYGFDDPQLDQQVEQVQQRFDEVKKKTEDPATYQNRQVRTAAQQALSRQYQNEYVELHKLGKEEEALVVLDKGAKDPALQPPDEYEERFRLEAHLRYLEGKGRKLILDIQASYPPLNWTLLKQIGTLKGYPLFRGVQQDVFLAVYVGPKGFRNPPVGKDPQKRQMKCFLAQAQFPLEEKYEALARQMLEKIDYDGLAKLVEP